METISAGDLQVQLAAARVVGRRVASSVLYRSCDRGDQELSAFGNFNFNFHKTIKTHESG